MNTFDDFLKAKEDAEFSTTNMFDEAGAYGFTGAGGAQVPAVQPQAGVGVQPTSQQDTGQAITPQDVKRERLNTLLKTKLQIDIKSQYPQLWNKIGTWLGQVDQLDDFLGALINAAAQNKARAMSVASGMGVTPQA